MPHGFLPSLPLSILDISPPWNCIFLLTSQNLLWSLLTSFVNHFYLPNFWTTITWRQVREDAANNSGRAPVTQDSNQILLHTPDTQIFPSSGLLCPIDAGRPIPLCKILNPGARVEPLDPAPLKSPRAPAPRDLWQRCRTKLVVDSCNYWRSTKDKWIFWVWSMLTIMDVHTPLGVMFMPLVLFTGGLNGLTL